MTYDTWVLLFLGMLTAMLLYNIAQWLWHRERVYGLYTLYMLVWLSYFLLRNSPSLVNFPNNVWYLLRTIGPMVAYWVYFEFTIAFLEVKKRQPKLISLFRYAQATLLVYFGIELVFCLATDLWQKPIHELVHTIVRVALAIFSIYIVIQVYKRRNAVARLFITGSLLLVIGGVMAMLFSLTWTSFQTSDAIPFWQAPLTYMHIGIFLELLCFSMGLAYRHRRESIRRALVDKELAREREQRLREQVEAQLAVQQLKHKMTEVQMRALQSQISPHFLFNSLNTLSSLIADEPERAEQFVDQMSSVYRYLLQANDRELTTLTTELTFIHSYYHLLKTRYGQGIVLDDDIADSFRSYLIPPLTLQLLVENAVKHNVVSANRPLRIRLSTSETGALCIWNNLQRKLNNHTTSTQKGLLNIIEKYKLLHQPPIQINETADSFEVILQLIEPA